MSQPNQNKDKSLSNKRNATSFRWLRRLLRVLSGILVIIFLLILFVRSQWGQDIIKEKLLKYVSEKTNTKVDINKLYLTLEGNLLLDGLYLEDQKGDTLLYSRSLEANIPLWKTITGKAYGLDELKWDGFKAKIIKEDSLKGFNYQFIVDAFSDEDNTVNQSSTTEPVDVVIGNFDLSDFNITYVDNVSGIDSKIKFTQLDLKMSKTDINNMIFDVDKFYLQDADIRFHLNKKSIKTQNDSITSKLPKVSITKALIKNVKTDIETPELSAKTKIVDFYIEIPELDLADNNFEINTIQLKDSDLNINLQQPKVSQVNIEDNETKFQFEWPELKIDINDVAFKNNRVKYSINNQKPVAGQFNPEAIFLEKSNVLLQDISYLNKNAELKIKQISMEEFSGLKLNFLKADLVFNDKTILIENFNTSLDLSKIEGFAEFNFTNFQTFLDNPENTKFKCNFSDISISVKDFLAFQPSLNENPYFNTLSEKTFEGQVNLDGTFAELNINNFEMAWGKNTNIFSRGYLQNLTQKDKFSFNLPILSAKTTRTDLLKFIDESALGICLPGNLELSGMAEGTLQDVNTQLKLDSSHGMLALESQFKNQNTVSFNSNMRLIDFKLNQLLDNEQFGVVNLELKAEGEGKSLNTLNGKLDLLVSEFEYNSYTYKNLKAKANLNDGSGHLKSDYKDKNLDFNLDSNVEFSNDNTFVTVKLNLNGVDLSALGFLNRQIKTGFDLDLNFNKKKDGFKLNSNINDAVVVYNNKTYLVGNIKTSAEIFPDTTSLSINNKMLSLILKSNTDPKTFSQSLSEHIKSYFIPEQTDTTNNKNAVKVELKGSLAQSPLLNEVILVNTKRVDTIDLSLNYDQSLKKLNTKLVAPYINYGGNEIDNLKFEINTDAKNINFNAGFNKVEAGAVSLPYTRINGFQKDAALSLNFEALHDSSPVFNINSELKKINNQLIFKIIPENLILNSNAWQIPKTNQAVFDSESLNFKDFKISRTDQSLEINSKNSSKPHLALDFKNFELSEILSYFNPERSLLKGELNGNFTIEKSLTSSAFTADFDVNHLKLLDTDLGKLDVTGKSENNNQYSFNAFLTEGLADIDINGNYNTYAENSNLNLNLNINTFQMKALESLTQNEINEGEGSLSGAFNLQIKDQKTTYQGNIDFNQAKFKVKKLNTKFLFENESLSIDESGLTFNNFNIKDEEGNNLTASGIIGTENFINPSFDLRFNAKDFKILDAEKEDNNSYYGKAIVDVDATLGGDLQIPVLKANFKVNSKTDVVYVMPEGSAAIEKRDGVVNFVNRKNPDEVLTGNKNHSGTFTGFNINSQIKIDPKAGFTIVLDQETEDQFQVQGQGDFNLQVFPNGRINLAGQYEASDGSYRLSLYNLVKRKFYLAPGSRVTWNGDPFNAKLDVRAIYNIESSAYSLMSPQISGLDPSVKSKYRQVLPFEVYLNIDGELLKPDISFDLDMPQDERGAINGQVYSRVKQVNQQEEELSKQVFSLLVLGRFYPTPGSDGSAGGIQTLAQDNLNDAISEQLNAYSAKILGNSGVNLDFGLNSYTDFQGDAPTERTELNVAAQKKLFNDRLTIRVGSEIDVEGSDPTGNTAPVNGNVSLIYELTKDGRYRLKGFRRNRFENIVDGETIVSGIALIFTKEFNKFDELWRAMFKKIDEDNLNEK